MARSDYAIGAMALFVGLSTFSLAQAQSVQTDYTYDLHGRLKTVTRPGSTTVYTYDRAQNRTRVQIAVSGCAAPVAGSTSATVAFNSASNVIPLNLSGGTATSVAYVMGTSHGSVQAIGATMYYSPFAGYAGPDSFTYNAANACGVSNTATVSLTVSPANRNPIAGTDNVTIAANSYAYFDPRPNDSDPDGDPLTLVSVTPPSHGNSWTNSNNYVSYVPTAGWSGSDAFTYTISDGRGGTATGAINITVTPPPPNNPPTANPGTTDPVWQATTVAIDPRANDTDPGGDSLTIQSIDNFYFAYGRINGVDLSGSGQAPSDIGSVTNNGTSITYRAPFLSNNGSAASNYIAVVVWYTIRDGRGGTSQSYQIINTYGPQ